MREWSSQYLGSVQIYLAFGHLRSTYAARCAPAPTVTTKLRVLTPCMERVQGRTWQVRQGLWVVPSKAHIPVSFNINGNVETSLGISGRWCHITGLFERILMCFYDAAKRGHGPRVGEDDAKPFLLRHVGGGAWRCDTEMAAVFVQTHPEAEAVPWPWAKLDWSNVVFLLIWMHPGHALKFVWLRDDNKVEPG